MPSVGRPQDACDFSTVPMRAVRFAGVADSEMPLGDVAVAAEFRGTWGHLCRCCLECHMLYSFGVQHTSLRKWEQVPRFPGRGGESPTPSPTSELRRRHLQAGGGLESFRMYNRGVGVRFSYESAWHAEMIIGGRMQCVFAVRPHPPVQCRTQASASSSAPGIGSSRLEM